MASLEKIAEYLDSFKEDDANYDYACYIKHKLAEYTSNNSSDGSGISTDEDLGHVAPEAQITDKTKENLEGSLMEPAFKELNSDENEESSNTQKPSAKVAESKNYVKELLSKIQRRK